MSDVDEEFLITIEQAAAKYMVGKRTLWRMLADGRLTRYRRGAGRSVRIDRRQLEQLLRWRPEDD